MFNNFLCMTITMSFSFGGGDYRVGGEGGKINIDELYETRQKSDLFKLETYNKVLARVHSRIKMTGRRSKQEQYCWYVVPEVMLGAPTFDRGECIAYLVNELQDNGFAVRYTHPNLLFVSWQHWVPDYVRNEIKKKTGVVVNGMGMKVGDKETSAAQNPTPSNPDALLFQSGKQKKEESSKSFKPTDLYRPSGALKYTDDVLSSLNEKVAMKLNS